MPRDAIDNATSLVERMRAGELAALSRVVTDLERQSLSAPALLTAMKPFLGKALVVGVTGPPGAGKSTLVNALIGDLRRRGLSIGVIAVDPSSPISGGAILGDRIRMAEHIADDDVFVRSLASRGHLGGLSPAAVRVIDGLDAAGKDVVILETVGAGQSEVDIAEIADLRLVVMAPGLGDGIQAMKAGILEIADLVIVNKCDLPNADRTARQLTAALALRPSERRETAVLKTAATTGKGMDAVGKAVVSALATARATPSDERRRRRARHLIGLSAVELVGTLVKEQAGDQMATLCDEVLTGCRSPFEAARKLLSWPGRPGSAG